MQVVCVVCVRCVLCVGCDVVWQEYQNTTGSRAARATKSGCRLEQKGTHIRQQQRTPSKGDHRRERDKAWGESVRWRASWRKRDEWAWGPAWQGTVGEGSLGQERQC